MELFIGGAAAVEQYSAVYTSTEAIFICASISRNFLFQNTLTSQNVASNTQNYVSFLLDSTTKCGRISRWKSSQQAQS